MRVTEVIRKRKIIVLLSIIIIVPVFLLAAFTLMHETQTPETVMGEAVTWEIERPDMGLDIWETVENSYMDEGCSILFDILISHYDPDAMEYKNYDYVSLVAEAEANASNGFVKGLRISFSENYNWSQVNILEEPDYKYSIKSENLRTRNVVDYADEPGGTGGLGETSKGYVEAAGVNKPNHVYYRICVHWILRSPQNQSHQMQVTLQLTYNNGTALKEAVLPVVLKLALDAGDTFETAKEIGFGNYTGWTHITTDPEDFYKVWMDEGKTVRIQLSPKIRSGYIFDLHLYNPSGEIVASSCSKIQDNTEEITYAINQSGWWYIRVVNAYAAYGLYTLSIQEAEAQ